MIDRARSEDTIYLACLQPTLPSLQDNNLAALIRQFQIIESSTFFLISKFKNKNEKYEFGDIEDYFVSK